MVDSLHNAVNNYYLINGDLRGIWNDIPKDIIITNWNLGKLDASMSFLKSLGLIKLPHLTMMQVILMELKIQE